MRVAALYDIHGNLPALEAVLCDVKRAQVDLVVVGGDVIPGPMVRESLACLLELPVPVLGLQGNGEREVLAFARDHATSTVPEPYREMMRWVGAQLGPEQRLQFDSWPATRRVSIEGIGEVLFCHATPRNDTDIFTRETPASTLLPYFAGADAPLVVCGHTHMQFDRQIGTCRVVNAGSVGMPFGDVRASWLLLGPTVELRTVSYDAELAATRIRATDYPGAESFVTDYVLHSPLEREMLDRFARVAIR